MPRLHPAIKPSMRESQFLPMNRILSAGGALNMNPIEENCTFVEEQPKTIVNPNAQPGITEEERERWLGDGGAVRPED